MRYKWLPTSARASGMAVRNLTTSWGGDKYRVVLRIGGNEKDSTVPGAGADLVVAIAGDASPGSSKSSGKATATSGKVGATVIAIGGDAANGAFPGNGGAACAANSSGNGDAFGTGGNGGDSDQADKMGGGGGSLSLTGHKKNAVRSDKMQFGGARPSGVTGAHVMHAHVRNKDPPIGPNE